MGRTDRQTEGRGATLNAANREGHKITVRFTKPIDVVYV